MYLLDIFACKSFYIQCVAQTLFVLIWKYVPYDFLVPLIAFIGYMNFLFLIPFHAVIDKCDFIACQFEDVQARDWFIDLIGVSLLTCYFLITDRFLKCAKSTLLLQKLVVSAVGFVTQIYLWTPDVITWAKRNCYFDGFMDTSSYASTFTVIMVILFDILIVATTWQNLKSLFFKILIAFVLFWDVTIGLCIYEFCIIWEQYQNLA